MSDPSARLRVAFLMTKVYALPFWGIFILIPLILSRELQASIFEITTAIALRPMVSLLSPYWSLALYRRGDRLVSNIFWANILKYVPFLFFPWVDNHWFFIFSFGLYWALKRGVMPAWMEMIKLYLPEKTRSRLFAQGSMIEYLGGIFLPLFFGAILDGYAGSWRWVISGAALSAIASSWLIARIPSCPREEPFLASPQIDLMAPWKTAWTLLANRKDFMRFQMGFMLGGAGLMVMQPGLQGYFAHVLHLSYTDMLLALATFKGIGFALTSPWWVKAFQRWNIYRFCTFMALLSSLFPLLIFFSSLHMGFLYFGYFIYGIMQAASELAWNMSGPLFAKESDSIPFSSVNVLAVGVRGFLPYLGGALCIMSDSTFVMGVGGAICLAGMGVFWKADQESLRRNREI